MTNVAAAPRPRRFLLEPLDTATDPRERMQPYRSVIGSTPAVHALMFPCRYDAHMVEWRWHRYLARFPK